MATELENMTDRQLAEAAVDSNNNFRRLTERALQEIDRLRESERETVGALEWTNDTLRGLQMEYSELTDAVRGLQARLAEGGAHSVAHDLEMLLSQSAERLSAQVFGDPARLH